MTRKHSIMRIQVNYLHVKVAFFKRISRLNLAPRWNLSSWSEIMSDKSHVPSIQISILWKYLRARYTLNLVDAKNMSLLRRNRAALSFVDACRTRRISTKSLCSSTVNDLKKYDSSIRSLDVSTTRLPSGRTEKLFNQTLQQRWRRRADN